jgi:hypothetical protein
MNKVLKATRELERLRQEGRLGEVWSRVKNLLQFEGRGGLIQGIIRDDGVVETNQKAMDKLLIEPVRDLLTTDKPHVRRFTGESVFLKEEEMFRMEDVTEAYGYVGKEKAIGPNMVDLAAIEDMPEI